MIVIIFICFSTLYGDFFIYFVDNINYIFEICQPYISII